MFSFGLSHHLPLIQDVPGSPPAAPPAPAPTPSPPPAVPLAFSVVTRASVYGIVGTPLGTVTLATVTCTDAGATIRQSIAVPGLTFSYAGNVLTVAGTPTGNAALYRVVVSYIASSDGAAVLGSSEHEVTIANAAQVLTVGAMAGVSGQVGVSMSVVLCSPTTNFDVDVQCVPYTSIPGLTSTWAWNRAGRAGTLTLAGTPTATFGPGGSIAYYFTGNGSFLGLGASTGVITAAYQPPAPAPAPAPAPPAPSPSPPPAPTPAPAPGRAPDPYLSSTKVLMHFDDNPGLSVDQNLTFDERGNAFTNYGATQGVGAVGAAAVFSGASISATVSGCDGASGALTVECMVNISAAGWDALTASSGAANRYSPVMSLIASDGGPVWSMGFFSTSGARYTAEDPRRVVMTAWMQRNNFGAVQFFIGSYLTSWPNRFLHLAAGMRVFGLSWKNGMWTDGAAGANSGSTDSLSRLLSASPATAQFGGHVQTSGISIYGSSSTELVEFNGAVDEARITAASRYAAYVESTLPPASRVIPWPNY